MSRHRRIPSIAALLCHLLVLLLAGVASASEGELVIIPHDAHGHFDFTELLILMALFAVLIYPMNALILRPILRILDERREKTAGTRRSADKLFADAEQSLERYEEAVRGARQDAESRRKETLEEARAESGNLTSAARGEAEGEVSRARAEIASSLEQARGQLRAQAEGLAREVAERTLGRSLS